MTRRNTAEGAEKPLTEDDRLPIIRGGTKVSDLYSKNKEKKNRWD